MKTACIYGRVSDPGQLSGLSPEVQKELCVKWAKANGYQVVGIYEDGGKSGTKTVGRDGLEDLIIHCQQNHVDVALVIDTDRIARNEFDHYNIRRELKKGGTQLIAINQPMIDDSPEGKLMDGMLASINAFYSRLTGRKVKKSLEKKVREGIFPGWAPLGYLNINKGTIEKPNRVIEVDPEKGHHMTELFRLYSTGNYSVDALADMMFKQGLRSKNNKRVYRSVLYNLLKNPFYKGMFRYNDQILPGKHIALTTPEIFDACQKVSQIHNQNACRRRKYKWLLNGFAYCQQCSSKLYGDYCHNKELAYYHGTVQKGCRHYTPLGDLEREVAEQLGKIKFSEEFTNRIIEKAKELVNRSRETKDQEVQAIRNAIKQLENKRNLLEDNLLDQTIDKDAFKRKHTELNLQIQNKECEIATIENQGGFDIDAVCEILDLTNNLYDTFTKANFYAKRHYLSIFIERVEVKNKKIAKVIYTPLFQSLIEAHSVRIRHDLLPR